MKKILTIVGITIASLVYSQGGTMIVNNYTPYEYRGALIANNFSGGCYPIIGTNAGVIIPPDSHTGNGNALIYTNYRDQYTTSLYPMPSWTVSLAANSNSIRPWNHGSLIPGGTLSNNTKWSASKFEMYDPATSAYVPGFNTTVSLAGNSCYMAPDYFVTPSGANSAEIFTITTSTGLVETYLQLY
ncbi:hypothetical protein [Chryseobacterium lathyri]|uniref:Uncharacterized protein n=1 Tax=Chryseobacterium lathyri TaxID=395933 RepID=A0ABT9SL52_9FLAO|nr:hypothetical protein [Chryseobacterium lathyri]MDP9960155.1 hypothetical protein [Chryseobacterium lathyri]MDQ0067603.1 hypothetical protein [Chryseobacterium lathyri]